MTVDAATDAVDRRHAAWTYYLVGADIVLPPADTAAAIFAVDWNNDGDFSDPYEDLTNYVLEADFEWGRDRPSQLTGRSSAGTLTLRLKNPDGIFSSFNGLSPIYGQIVPGRRVRVQILWLGSYYRLFTGRLDSVQPQPIEAGRVQRATLRAIGSLGALSQRKVAVPMTANVLTGAAVGVVLDEIGWPAWERALDTGQTLIKRFSTGYDTKREGGKFEKVDALQALHDIEATELGFIRELKTGYIAFEDSQHRLVAPHTVNQVVLTDLATTASGYLQYQAITQLDELKEVYNIIEAEIRLDTVDADAVLWTLAQTGADSPSIASSGSQNFYSVYPNPSGPRDGVSVDAWTTPSVGSADLKANSKADGTGADLSSFITINTVKLDNEMKVALTNTHSSTAYITLLRARGTAVRAKDPVTVRAEDGDSKTAYGERSYPLTARYLPTLASGQALCNKLLSTYKRPIPVLEIGYRAQRSYAHMYEALIRDVSDRIRVRADNASQLGIDRDFFVEKISWRMKPKDWHITYQLSPASYGLGGGSIQYLADYAPAGAVSVCVATPGAAGAYEVPGVNDGSTASLLALGYLCYTLPALDRM